MKKIIVIIGLLLTSFVFQSAFAQTQVRLNVNIGSQPVWGPVGYSHVEYYYMPDIDAYYYVPKHQFIYQEGTRWIFATSLPSRFSNYDMYNGYKVVVNEPKPYLHSQTYRSKYSTYKGRHDQKVIRDSHDPKYFEIKDHPEHSKWQKNHKGGNGHG